MIFSFVVLITLCLSAKSTVTAIGEFMSCICEANKLTLFIASACYKHQGDIRLVNGSNKYEGRVELCDSGEWKSVCLFGWSRQEAMVACRQLGFSGNLNR